jgi:uncharacterized protein (TIGR03437 family)
LTPPVGRIICGMLDSMSPMLFSRVRPWKFLFGIFAHTALFLSAATGFAQTTALPFKPVAFEYSKTLDRLILISANPNRLHIYNTSTAQTVSVPLAQPPLSVSVSPDGLRAAVGHDALISYVDLEKGAVLKTFPVPAVVTGIVAASSWIYTYGFGYSGSPQSVNIQTGQAVANTSAFFMTGAKLNTAVNTIYGARDGTSPNDVERWEISTGPVTRETDSPYHGDFCIYGPVWFSPDGARIYTGCGTVFRASTDPKLDMYYLSSIAGINQIAALDESAALQKLALIRRASSFGITPPPDEGVVQIFDSPYLVPAGQFTLSSFTAAGKTYAPHGRAVFFTADSTELIIVEQADSASGLLNDYAVQRIPLAARTACGAGFAVTSVAVPAEGGTGSVNVTSPVDCVYQATSLVPWITIVSGALGSGNGMLRWSVAANPDSVARTGTIVLPGQVLTFTQAPASASPTSLYVTGYNAVDASYARGVDKVVLVSGNPNQLHIFDPSARSDTTVSLSAPPLSLSVRPDGTQAVVGHDGWVTLVDLTTARVLKIYPVATDVHSLVFAGNGYAYLFPLAEWGNLFSLNLASGQVTQTSAIYNGREPRLHVNGRTIYVGGQSQSKWDISAGVAKLVTGWPSSAGCGKLWLTQDGRRQFGSCGKAYTTSDVAAQDYQYNGSLSEATGIAWLDESAVLGTTAAIPTSGPAYNGSAKATDDTQVQLYNDSFLEYLGAIPLPKVTVGGATFPSHGRFVFWNQAGTGLYAVVQADSNSLLANGTAIVTLSVGDAKRLTVSSFVNSASQAQGRISAGEAITIYGSGLGPKPGVAFTVDPLTRKVSTNLAGTEVYVNGVAAPVLFASDTQVNAIVPFELQASGQVILQVANQGVLASGTTVTLAAAVPGIFTMNGTGSGQAVAVNLDGTVCDAAHPAAPGSFITVYFTGGGATTPSGATGGVAGSTLKRLSQTTLATVADIPATVSFAGAAPTLVEGVNQVNIKLDDKTPSGLAQPLILTVGNNSSPSTATIAVK